MSRCSVAKSPSRRLLYVYERETFTVLIMERVLEAIILAHTVWMDQYEGDIGTIVPSSFHWKAAGHVAERSGEAYNFAVFRGKCEGYVSHFKQINVNKLGASDDDRKVSGITVVWTATPRKGEARRVIGWYRNATVFRDAKKSRNPVRKSTNIFFTANSGNCVLLPIGQRDLEVPRSQDLGKGLGPGTAAIHFPGPELAKKLFSFIADYKPTVADAGVLETDINSLKKPRQPDIAKRLAVEQAAMNEVRAILAANGWSVHDRTLQSCGWDYTASKPGIPSLLIEIKGLSGPELVPELSPNEFKHLKLHQNGSPKGRYVIAIVTDALDSAKRKLHAFGFEKRGWLPFDLGRGKRISKPTHTLILTDAVAARCSLKPLV